MGNSNRWSKGKAINPKQLTPDAKKFRLLVAKKIQPWKYIPRVADVSVMQVAMSSKVKSIHYCVNRKSGLKVGHSSSVAELTTVARLSDYNSASGRKRLLASIKQMDRTVAIAEE